MPSQVFSAVTHQITIKQETAHGLLSPLLGSGRLKAVQMTVLCWFSSGGWCPSVITLKL